MAIRIKYIFIAIVCICVLSVFYVRPVYAAETNTVQPEMFPSNFDKEYVTNDIIHWLNESYRGDAGIKTTKEDIDLSKAYKIYDVSSIPNLKFNTLSDLVATIEKQGDYYYDIAIDDGNVTYDVTVEYYNPLSDDAMATLTKEEIDKYNEKVGKWAVSSAGVYEDESPYKKYDQLLNKTVANEKGTSLKKPILIIGYPYILGVSVLYPDSKGNVDALAPVWPQNVDYEELGLAEPKEGTTYNFADMETRVEKAMKNSVGDNTIGGAGGASSETKKSEVGKIIALSICVLLIAGIVVSRYSLRKKRANNIE